MFFCATKMFPLLTIMTKNEWKKKWRKAMQLNFPLLWLNTMTLVYFLKFFIHKLDASLQIVLYMVKITLTMRKKCNKTEACWQRVTHWSLPPSPSNTPPSERMNEWTNERTNEEKRHRSGISHHSLLIPHTQSRKNYSLMSEWCHLFL